MTQQCLNRHFGHVLRRYAVTFVCSDASKQTVHVCAVSEKHAKQLAEKSREHVGGIVRFLSVVNE
jgi:hypothetical protein